VPKRAPAASDRATRARRTGSATRCPPRSISRGLRSPRSPRARARSAAWLEGILARSSGEVRGRGRERRRARRGPVADVSRRGSLRRRVPAAKGLRGPTKRCALARAARATQTRGSSRDGPQNVAED
jgi:hypothetical protein